MRLTSNRKSVLFPRGNLPNITLKLPTFCLYGEGSFNCGLLIQYEVGLFLLRNWFSTSAASLTEQICINVRSNQETHVLRKAPVVMTWQVVIPPLIRPNYTTLTHSEWHFTAQVLPAMLVWLLVYYTANLGEVEWLIYFFHNLFYSLSLKWQRVGTIFPWAVKKTTED